MKIKKVAFLLSTTLVLASSLFAELDPIKINAGKLTIEPAIYASAEYDDNIFLRTDDPEGDFRYRIRPELEFIYGNKLDDHIYLGLAYEWEIYDKFTDQNDENWYLNTGIFWEFTKSTFFLKADYSTDTSGDVEEGALTRETRVDLHSEFDRTISSKTSASILFDLLHRDYPSDPTLIGYSDLSPAARFYYKLFPKADIFGEFAYGYVNRTGYDSYDDHYNTYSIGIRREQTAKLDFEGKIGGQYRVSDEPGTTDKWHLTFYLKSVAKFSRLTTLTIHGGQFISPSSNNLNSDKTELWLEALLDKKISDSDFYIDLSAKYRHLEWENIKDEDTYRKDDEYTFKIGGYYKFSPELKTGLSYQFRTDQSSIDSYDFDDNQVTIYLNYSL
jgi:disulfide oxidoreductase YuzD